MADQLINFDNLISALIEMGEEVGEAYKQNLANSGHNTTEYALSDSVKTRIAVNGEGYEVVMDLNDYWKYVEWDTKPHFPPPSSLMRWITIKPIFPRPYRGKLPTTQQLAYLIGRKISEQGTKGTYDLQRAKDAVVYKYEQRIKEALGEDVGNYIRNTMGRRLASD